MNVDNLMFISHVIANSKPANSEASYIDIEIAIRMLHEEADIQNAKLAGKVFKQMTEEY